MMIQADKILHNPYYLFNIFSLHEVQTQFFRSLKPMYVRLVMLLHNTEPLHVAQELIEEPGVLHHCLKALGNRNALNWLGFIKEPGFAKNSPPEHHPIGSCCFHFPAGVCQVKNVTIPNDVTAAALG